MKSTCNRERFVLGWLDPRDDSVNYAGVGFYNQKYGEYALKVDEDSRTYFLKPYDSEQGQISYRMEIVIKRRDGGFLKRQVVGFGHSNGETQGNVHIKYGSKFKILVLYLKDYQ